MEIYRKETSFKTESFGVQAAKARLEEKLKIAEASSITLSVGQDGGSDFRSIGEALNSIQLPNTRRVILNIQPGIYR